MKKPIKPDTSSMTLFASDEQFAKACTTIAGIKSLLDEAKAADYHVSERWRWRTGSQVRHGLVYVEDHQGEVLWVGEWASGSKRMIPENFRVSSRHGTCLLDALKFIRATHLAAQTKQAA